MESPTSIRGVERSRDALAKAPRKLAPSDWFVQIASPAANGTSWVRRCFDIEVSPFPRVRVEIRTFSPCRAGRARKNCNVRFENPMEGSVWGWFLSIPDEVATRSGWDRLRPFLRPCVFLSQLIIDRSDSNRHYRFELRTRRLGLSPTLALVTNSFAELPFEHLFLIGRRKRITAIAFFAHYLGLILVTNAQP